MDRPKRFPYFTLLLPRGRSEAAFAAVWSNGALGVEEIAADDALELHKVYFENDAALLQCMNVIERVIREAVILRSDSVDCRDWESFLHGGFEPWEVGPLFVVPAENPPPVPPSFTPLYIIPGRGFGTGGHPTTQLCLRALVDLMKPGLSVLDVGAGSGILAIAAGLLGAERVFGVDIDADAIENARENVDRNGLSSRVHLAHGSIDVVRDGPFDIVCVNIIAHAIRQLLDRGLADLAAPGGALLASGILGEELPALAERFAAFGFEEIERGQNEEWRSLTLCKR